MPQNKKNLNLNWVRAVTALANRTELFNLAECGVEGRLLVKQCDHEGVTSPHQKVYIPLDTGGNLYIGADLDLADNITIHGDLTFDGTAGHGMVHGEIYAYGVASVITSVAINDWDQIVAFAVNGLSNRTTPDHTNDHITISEAGRYELYAVWGGFGPAVAHDWDFHFKLNNGAVNITNAIYYLTTPASRKKIGLCFKCVYELAVGDTVELWVERYSAGNNIDLETYNCTLGVLKIGA